MCVPEHGAGCCLTPARTGTSEYEAAKVSLPAGRDESVRQRLVGSADHNNGFAGGHHIIPAPTAPGREAIAQRLDGAMSTIRVERCHHHHHHHHHWSGGQRARSHRVSRDSIRCCREEALRIQPARALTKAKSAIASEQVRLPFMTMCTSGPDSSQVAADISSALQSTFAVLSTLTNPPRAPILPRANMFPAPSLFRAWSRPTTTP